MTFIGTFTLERCGENGGNRSRPETTDASSAAKHLLGEREGGPSLRPQVDSGSGALQAGCVLRPASGAGLTAGALQRPVTRLSDCRRVRNHALGTQTLLGLESGAEEEPSYGQTGSSQLPSSTAPWPQAQEGGRRQLRRGQAPASTEFGVSSCPAPARPEVGRPLVTSSGRRADSLHRSRVGLVTKGGGGDRESAPILGPRAWRPGAPHSWSPCLLTSSKSRHTIHFGPKEGC